MAAWLMHSLSSFPIEHLRDKKIIDETFRIHEEQWLTSQGSG